MDVALLSLTKLLHVGTAAISIAGFTVRGIWMLRDSARLHARWVRIAPHVVDTLLLVSAIGLAVQLRLSPVQHTWLLAKIVALLLYIGLGVVALRRGRNRLVRALAWVAALATYLYIVAVAVTKSPWGPLAWL